MTKGKRWTAAALDVFETLPAVENRLFQLMDGVGFPEGVVNLVSGAR